MQKTHLSRTMLAVVLGLSAWTAGSTVARAAAVPSGGAITPVGEEFSWSFPIQINGNERVEPGDYFVLYDFHGYTGTHSEPEGWKFTTPVLGPVPSGLAPIDDEATINLVWERTGSALTSADGVSQFLAGSIYSNRTLSYFTSQNTVGTGDLAGTKLGSIGRVDSPAPPRDGAPVPEPGTLTIGLLLGASGLAWHRRRRRSA